MKYQNNCYELCMEELGRQRQKEIDIQKEINNNLESTLTIFSRVTVTTFQKQERENAFKKIENEQVQLYRKLTDVQSKIRVLSKILKKVKTEKI